MPETTKKPMISICSNKFYFFLHEAFILESPDSDNYRLLAIHNKQVKIDRLYKTKRGARIGFSKIYPPYTMEVENEEQITDIVDQDASKTITVKATWSHFYPVDKKWLAERLKIADEQTTG